MFSVDDYILNRKGEQREILLYLHSLLSTYKQVQYKIAWGIPCYYQHKHVCSLNPIKNDGIELAFVAGKTLNQPDLNEKGRSHVAGFDFYKMTDIKEERVLEIFELALAHDQNVKNASIRKPK